MAAGPDPLTTLIAFNRFGLGARPGDFAAASSDPRGFLVAELKMPDAALIASGLPSSKEAFQQVFADRRRRKEERARTPVPGEAMKPENAQAMAEGGQGAMGNTPSGDPAMQGAVPMPMPMMEEGRRSSRASPATCTATRCLPAPRNRHRPPQASSSGW